MKHKEAEQEANRTEPLNAAQAECNSPHDNGRRQWLMLAGASLILSACGQPDSSAYAPQFGPAPGSSKQVYFFGVHPLHNPKRLFEVYGPLLDYLSQHVPGATFRLEASRDYADYNKKLEERHFHLALPNPYQTLKAIERGYRVFAKMGDDHNFRGILLVRKDSGIERVSDLRGKAVSYPAPTALAATMLPQYYLQTHGLDINRDIENRYVGSQESSILNVYQGKTAAGATWPPPWQALARERPELATALEVKWQTQSLPNNSLMARDDMPAEVINALTTALLSLQDHPEGQALLARLPLSRFEAANNDTYQPVRDFMRQFSQLVRPLD